MKELTQEFKDKEVGHEVLAEQQQKKEIVLIGQQRKVRGLSLFEFNFKTKELCLAKFQKQDVSITSLNVAASAIKINNRVVVNENCVYFQALNLKNAKKRINKKLK